MIDINQKNALLLLLLAEYDRQQSQTKDYMKVSFNQWLFTNDVINSDEYRRLESQKEAKPPEPNPFQKVFNIYPNIRKLNKGVSKVPHWTILINQQNDFLLENVLNFLFDTKPKVSYSDGKNTINIEFDLVGYDIDIKDMDNNLIHRLYYYPDDCELTIRKGNEEGLYILLMMDLYIKSLPETYESDDLPPM